MRIVLVRPRDPNNIGAAARAMANFGLDDLVVVAPWAPVWREARAAIGAGDVLAHAREAASVDDAIADCAFAGATTAGTRRALDRVVAADAFAREARATEAAGARVALVFGNEKHGLARADIDRCHVTVRIATRPAQPSMNLAHAVAVCCYEWARGHEGDHATSRPRRRARPATLGEIDAAVAALVPTAADAGVEARRGGARDRLRALLVAARASTADLALLRGLARGSDIASDNDRDRPRHRP
jgi:tRNA/rRNA methyltransferase